jgi:Uma2 family endonuclease
MATNLQLDDQIIEMAMKLGGHKTKKDAVTQALIEYNRHLQQLKVLELFGTIDYEANYDYKLQRRQP